jgi:hypothetical protein
VSHWLTPDEAREGPVYLLEVAIGGTLYRLASEPLAEYRSGIVALSLTRQLDFLSTDIPTRDAQLEICLPDLDVALLRSRGALLAGEEARIYLTVPSRSAAQRILLLEGLVTDPEYGGLGEAYTFTVTASPPEEGRIHPPPEVAITAETWAESGTPEASTGQPYPVIIGGPGYQTGTRAYRATPGYLVGYSTTAGHAPLLLLAGHACGPNHGTVATYTGPGAAPITGSSCGGSVRVTDTSNASEAVRTVYNVRDLTGRVVAVCVLGGYGGAGPLEPGDGEHPYQVRWNSVISGVGSAPAFGLARQDGERLGGLASVVEWGLELAGLTVDRGRLRAMRALLDHVQINAAILEPTDMLRWVEEVLLPLAPVSLAMGEGGAFVHMLERRVLTGLTLEAGRNCWRVGRVLTSVATAASVAVDYCWAISTNKATLQATRRAGAGRTGVKRLETAAITRTVDADWVAGWLAEIWGQDARTVQYTGGLELLAVQPGDMVRLVDTSLYLDTEALVVRVDVGVSAVSLECRVV